MRASAPLAWLVAGFVFGCGNEAPSAETAPTREALEGGAMLVRYPGPPEASAQAAVPDLVLGDSDDPDLLFGDVRSVEARSDGSIYVLDYQATAVRAFDVDGDLLGTVVSRGEGPGEITAANGMAFVGDSVLWIQDHGSWQMLAVRPNGEELRRVRMPVLSYGYVWSGTVDHQNRIWKTATHSDAERSFPPELGLNESSARLYMKNLDPETGRGDSILLGEVRYRSFVQQNEGRYSHWTIPFDPRPITVASQDGSIWHAEGESYRILRLSATGDTLLVLEVASDPLPVTAEDRSRFVAEQGERGPRARRGAESVAELMRDTKPAIEALLTDDQGRLWVRRAGPEGERPTYDVFTRAGDYSGSVMLGFQPQSFVPIRVRFGNIYAVVLDTLDVPTVVRAPIPAPLR